MSSDHTWPRARRRTFMKAGAGISIIGAISGCTGLGPETEDDGDDEVDVDVEDTPGPDEDVEYEPLPEFVFQTLPREDDPEAFEHTVMARQYLEALGFSFEWEVLEAGTWAEDLFAREYDLNRLTWFGTVERSFPYYNLYFSFHSDFATEEGGNFNMWESDEYDETVERFNEAFDEDDQIDHAYRCQEILGLNQPSIFTLHPDTLVAHNTEHFSNWNEMLGTDVYWNIETLRDLEAETDDADAVIFGTTLGQESYPNFFAVTGNSLETHKFSYDTPIAYDYNGELYGLAAEDWDVVDDTTVDVTLREGMLWHDGEEVTGSDLKWTWDAIAEYGVPYIASDVAPYESSELLDDYTVRFNLDFPFGGFPRISLFRVPILPQHIWEGVVEDEGLEHPREWDDPDMTGSGPFEFVEYSPGDRVVFQRNDDHRFADEIEFETLVYNIYGSEAAVVGDLADGTVTFTQGLGPENFDQAEQEDNVEAHAESSLAAHAIFLRCDIDPFTDVRVRQALAHAVNHQEIIDVVYRGQADNATSPIGPSNELYHNADTPGFDHNVDQARDLLADAGLRWDDDGTLLIPEDWEPEVEYVSPDD